MWWWAPRRRLLFCCSRPETTLALVSSCPEDGSEGFCRPPSANRGVDQKRAWSSASARSSTFGGNSSAYQQRFVTREFTWMETNATQPFFPRKTRPRSHRAEQLDSTWAIFGPAGRPARKLCFPQRRRRTGKDAGRSFFTIVDRSPSNGRVGQSAPT